MVSAKKTYRIIINRAKALQTLSIAATNAVTYGAADITPGATSNNGTLPITYISNNLAVATITNSGQVHIVGAGSVNITASQLGNSLYSDAVPVTQVLTVNPAPLTITANNKSKVYGSANPLLTVLYSGFVNGDDTTKLSTKAVVGTTATKASAVGNYPINISGAVSTNYAITYVPGNLVISTAVLTVTADNQVKNYGVANPVLTVSYSGFMNGDDATKLTTPPSVTTTATTTSAAGVYPITVSGASSGNYTFVYNNGVLTIIPAPLISSINPATAVSGTVVTITGLNFNSVNAVSFGGVPASSYSVVSSTSIVAVVGSGSSSGNVSVTTPSGTGTYAGFTFIPKPTIAANGSTTFLTGGNVMLTASPGTGYAYQWFNYGTPIAGATSATYTASLTGLYTVGITLNGVSQASQSIAVNVVFALPPNNFAISGLSATCKGSNNGVIKVVAAQHLNYTATVVGGALNNTTYSFTDSVSIPNLTAGSYNVCITVTGQSGYQQCFTVIINEPKDLSVYVASVNPGQVTINLNGASVYNVSLNGKTITTTSSQLTLALTKGANVILVSTDKACQGVIEKDITLADDIVAYPNPFDGVINLNLGKTTIQNAIISVFGVDGKIAYTGTFNNVSGVLPINLTQLRPGVYMLRLSADNIESVFKIIKK